MIDGWRKSATTAFSLFVAGTVAGCSWSMDSLGLGAGSSASDQKIAQGVAPEHLQPISGTVALGSISGPPPLVAQQMAVKLDRASSGTGLALLNSPGADGDYRLQGYMLVKRTRAQIEVDYIWDIFDRQGGRVGRAAGTERVPASGSQADVWMSVPEETLDKIAGQAMVALRSKTPVGVTGRQASGPPAC